MKIDYKLSHKEKVNQVQKIEILQIIFDHNAIKYFNQNLNYEYKCKHSK